MMTIRINNSIFIDYLSCNYKAYLKINGVIGKKTDYEMLQNRLLKKYRASVANFIKSKEMNENILKDSSLLQFITGNNKLGINIWEEFDDFDDIFDGIMKTLKSKDDFVPIVFVNKENVTIADKLHLAFCGFSLGSKLKRMPSFGRIIYGTDYSSLRVKLNKLILRISPIIESIKSFIKTKEPPQLYINKHCQICEFAQDCLKIAEDKDDLSLLAGLNPKKIKKLHNKGIFTVNQLSYTFKLRRKRKNFRKKASPFRPELKALALRENKVYVLETPELPKSDIEIYLDVEGLPDQNFYYLVGVLVNNNGNINKFSFWADNKDQEFDIFLNLHGILSEYENFIIYHYGDYEKKYIKKMIKKLKGNEIIKGEKLVERCCNVLSFFYSNIYVPTLSNGLKDIAKYFGYVWANENASGIQSILWRNEWEKNRSSEIKCIIHQYNIDDCFALKMVKDFVSSINENQSDSENSYPEIVYHNQLKNSYPFKFLIGEFANPAIENIHHYSLFDYQRQRVFVRTDNFIRKSEKYRVKKRRSVLRPNKIKTFSARVCVYCKRRNIYISRPISKRIIDLKFNDSGVKRWIKKLSSNIYHCKDCGKSFSPVKYLIGGDNYVPKGYRKYRTKYGHNIKSWVVYQHIVNHLSFRKIESNLYEFHKLAIDKSTLHEFKNYIQKYYNSTYKLLIDKIISSNVLYVDETPLKMKNEDGYAWVFTNNKEIVSIYRPTREGAFLKDFLKNFKGILVSDFYAVYDSINCIQQKCLIHLIRDMNDDLLKYPFNEELQFITHNFTTLIQKIVKTIDRFGLKKRHLLKYKEDAGRLIDGIVKKNFSTEIVLYYQERFKKNKDRLFEFVNHDNVSWNNNNAERAIKLLATHTNKKIKLFSENRMRDYLKIMSIYQTCVYNNVSLMKFLISKERNFDKFFENSF